MKIVTGLLLDVSGSMSGTVDTEFDEKGNTWAHSIFTAIDNFVKHDVSPDNQIFAVGVGSSLGKGFFDVLETIKQFRSTNIQHRKTYNKILEEFYKLVADNGAKSTERWAPKEVIQAAVPYDMAVLLLEALQSNEEFLKGFVNECLPRACRNLVQGDDFFANLFTKIGEGGAFVGSFFTQATKEDVEMVVEKAKGRMLKDVGSVFSVKKASEILHGCIDTDELTNDRVKSLMKTVRPFIYGRTPLNKALSEAAEIFSKGKYSNHYKLLFVLSDGLPTDHNLPSAYEKLKSLDVFVVGCFITAEKNMQPKKLYCVADVNWDKGAKFLFQLSSTISSQLLPRTIFIEKGWEIEIINNETKLFLQINHPDNIRNACNLARDVVCCQDSLSDLLRSVSLDMYINQTISSTEAHEQIGGTCYAYASAAVLHLSMMRILGRRDGYPTFQEIVNKLINKFGEKGAYTLNVLRETTPQYRLQCNGDIGIHRAMEAIVAKRPVVATFSLTKTKWRRFCKFFSDNPRGILSRAVIGMDPLGIREAPEGHAVVLTSFNSKCLCFMNSWGEKWADKGFFRVQDSEVLQLSFIDVYWTLNNLNDEEKNYFEANGANVAKDILMDLKSLQTARYSCPECFTSSLVTKFTGSLTEVVCPECKKTFRCNETGNILALNLYLTSLAGSNTNHTEHE